MTTPADRDEAMLAYLAGDDDVLAAAALIWDASGHLVDAQAFLEGATTAYTKAIIDSGIPAEHAERLGATLILRLNQQRLLDKAEHAEPDTEPPA